MNIDFHYGVIYLVTRLAGMDAEDARTVAHACQYVDDSTTPGVLEFAGGESYERFASAHKMLDYTNLIDGRDRLVWAPFHFLTAGRGETLEEKAVCRPDSEIAREMVRRAIGLPREDNALHRLGITLHVYVDTWAHQGFTGTISEHNVVTYLDGDDHDHDGWMAALADRYRESVDTVKANLLDVVSKLGHGSALHYPDQPWVKWRYTNGHAMEIHRDNLPQFIEAADMACRAVQGYLNGNAGFESEAGLPASARSALQAQLARARDTEPEARLMSLAQAMARGDIPGIGEALPEYVAKGEGSWKQAATGITQIDDGERKPVWSEAFEFSDYRKYHDAVKEHRFAVMQEILPVHGVRLA